MPKIMRLLALVAGAAATIQPLAHGQSAAINGEITGTVTDPSGAAIAGAVIQISNPATGFKREIKAAESGLYRFTLLPLGTYDLLGQAVGFADARRSGVTVNAGATVTVNISLQIAGARVYAVYFSNQVKHLHTGGEMFEAWGRVLYRRRRLTLIVTLVLVAFAAVWGTGVFGTLSSGNDFTRRPARASGRSTGRPRCSAGTTPTSWCCTAARP